MTEPHDSDAIDSPPPTSPRWFRYAATGCGSLLALLFVAFAAVKILMGFGVLPSSRAVPGSDVDARVRPWLTEAGLLTEQEEIIYFFSAGTFSYREDGNYFTDRRVVSYWEDDGKLDFETALYQEIAAIESEIAEGILEDSAFIIHRRDGTSFPLFVASEGDGDREFLRLLEEQHDAKWSAPPSDKQRSATPR